MTDREKLAELMLQGLDNEDANLCTNLHKLADHLIANGVILLPCKVGDTLYGIRKLSRLSPIYSFIAPDLGWIIENAYLFGKEIFTTYKSAETKLKESENK